MRAARIRRGAVSGGDTSGSALRALGAYALEAIAPIAPGAPLCRVFSTDPETDGFQITLKGGQMGDVDFFGSVRAAAQQLREDRRDENCIAWGWRKNGDAPRNKSQGHSFRS